MLWFKQLVAKMQQGETSFVLVCLSYVHMHQLYVDWIWCLVASKEENGEAECCEGESTKCIIRG